MGRADQEGIGHLGNDRVGNLRFLVFAFCGCAALMPVVQGCRGEVEPVVTAGVDACSHCNMVIDRRNQACGYVLGGRFIPFDSPKCLLRSYEALRRGKQELPEAVFFADYGTEAFHPADSTIFVLTDRVPTVMDARVVCFGAMRDARGFVQGTDELVEGWSRYQLARGVPDRRHDVVVSSEGMQPSAIEAIKGEFVELSLRGSGLREDRVLVVKGYDEVGEIRICASGEVTACRFWAVRPGAGFPVVDVADNGTIGMIKVAGAHTLDEELQ